MDTDLSVISQTDIRLLLRAARWALRYTWQTHRRLLGGVVLLTLVHSQVPAVLAVAVRGLINAITAVMRNPNTEPQPINLWLAIGLGVTLIDTVGDFARKYFMQRLGDELNLRLNTDILEHAATLDVAHFEDARFQDVMERTQQGVATRFTLFVDKTLRVLTGVLQMISLAGVLAVIEPLIVLVLAGVAMPYLFFQWRLSKSRYQMEFQRVTKSRWTRYFVTRLTSYQFVPEIKLLGLAPLLIRQFRDLMVEFRDQNRLIAGKIFRGSSLFAVLSSLAFYATFTRVAWRVLGGGLTIGDVAVYGGAMARLRNTLEDTILNVTAALEQTLHIGNLIAFFEIEPQIRQQENGRLMTSLPGRGEIQVENVTFTYPGASRPTLHHVSLHIYPGETVALVGRNGAGKTTLVKLLARLYEPDAGVIRFDGCDIRYIPPELLHRHVSFVFQQFGRYEATVADNIAYGNWQEMLHDRYKVEQIARMAGVHQMIQRMPQGYDTLLGRMFGEYSLSGGQWQKIAIARAFARPASLLILDEPTSNLDAQAEYEIFSRFRELANGRTTVLISHRFSTVSMADRILVMDKGRIVESGSHHELMAQGGLYANLYELHQRQYAWQKNGHPVGGQP
ncbi:MAG: ABC transporter ATP-binding protein [Chloroflexi bacterium]|nr:MAG: ABC transporter ATP-binding protein [Chloroflexota bacterium]